VTFYFWIILLTPESLDGLIAGLVREGITVKALSSDEVLHRSLNTVGCLVPMEIAFAYPDNVETGEGDEDDTDVLQRRVHAVLQAREVKHFGYVITEKCVCHWDDGNVPMVPDQPTRMPDSPPPAWSRLKPAS
jgi:hypothetical protein